MQDADSQGFREADLLPEKRLSRLRGRANPMPETAISYAPGACRS